MFHKIKTCSDILMIQRYQFLKQNYFFKKKWDKINTTVYDIKLKHTLNLTGPVM